MNEYDLNKYIEILIFPLFLVFIFLAIQIWLLWRDTDKNELKSRTIDNESFFKKSYVYVFFFSIFFILHKFFEVITPLVYHEFFEMLAVFSLVLFAYHWYRVFKASAYKKSLPKELTSLAKMKRRG